jgi:phenylacetate-CoA ligase
MCIAELVDADNQPVAPGIPSAKVLVTNLYNLAQPLIRYELTDNFVRQPDSADHGHLRAHVHGRADEMLHFGRVDVHPLVVRSVMVRSPEVVDYRVRQTPRGIEVDAIASGSADVEAICTRLASALGRAGLGQPETSVRIVNELEQHPRSGKLRRFVPLP